MLLLVLLDKICDQASDAVLVANFTLDLMCCEARVQDNIVHVADEITVAWNMDKNISAFWMVAVPHLLLSWGDENG